MRVLLREPPEQKVAIQERLAFNLLQCWILFQWKRRRVRRKTLWVEKVLVAVDHLVAERAQDVLDVPLVDEQHKLVVVRVVVAGLDEQIIFVVWGVVQYDAWKGIDLEAPFADVLHSLPYPNPQYLLFVFVVVVVHSIVIYHPRGQW